MAVELTHADLTPFAPDITEEQSAALIDDAFGLAARVAPCILDDDFAYAAAAKAILRGAILRWHESGSGAGKYTQFQAGPLGMTSDTRSTRKTMFWPTEINELQALCGTGNSGAAFSIDTIPGS